MTELLILHPRTIIDGRTTYHLRDSGGAEVASGTLYPPIEAATTAALLKKRGHAVDFMPADAMNLSGEAVVQKLETMRPARVLVPSAWGSLAEDVKLLARIKEALPGCVTMISGAPPSAMPEEIAELQGIDAAIIGDPDAILSKILAGADFQETDNLAFSNGDGVTINPRRLEPDLKTFPQPDWEILRGGNYRMPFTRSRQVTCLETSRGCNKRCTFCPNCNSFYGRSLQFKTREQAIGEIAAAVRLHGFREIVFKDLSLTINRERLIWLCREMRRLALDFRWRCFATADAVDPELLREMKRAGCYQVCYGFESGDAEVLRLSGKGVTLHQGVQAARWTSDAGLEVAGNFILGLLGETEASAGRTIDYALDLDLDYAQCLMAQPVPGTKFHRQCLKRGWVRRRVSEGRWYDMRVLDDPQLPAERLHELLGEFYRRFYFRLRYLRWRLRRTENLPHLIFQAGIAAKLASGAIVNKSRELGRARDDEEWLPGRLDRIRTARLQERGEQSL